MRLLEWYNNVDLSSREILSFKASLKSMKHLNYHKDTEFSEIIDSINTVFFHNIIKFFLSSQREREECVYQVATTSWGMQWRRIGR
jgi:hypothetical protein